MNYLIAVLLSTIVAFQAVAGTGPREQVMQLADRYVEHYYRAYPEHATYHGLNTGHNRLRDNTLAALKQRQQIEDGLLTDLLAIDSSALVGAPESIMLAYLKERLEADRALRVCRTELWSVNHLSGWQVTYGNLIRLQPVDTAAQQEAAIERWQMLGDWVDTEIVKLNTGLALGYSSPQRIVRLVIGQLDALLAMDHEALPFAAPIQAEVPESFRQRWLALLQTNIVPALQRYRDYLQSDYLKGARESLAVSALPNGEACYRAFYRRATSLNRSAEEVFNLGQMMVAANEKRLIALGKQRFNTDDPREIRRRINGDAANRFASEQEILQQAQALVAQGREVSTQWFGPIPDSPLEIEPISPALAATTSSYYRPAAADGKRPASFQINLHKPREQLRSAGAITAVHEAYPGHHLQAIMASKADNSHPLKRLVEFGGFDEGWARYAESLADEMGLYQDDYARLARLSWPARGMVADAGIHGMGWTPQQALDFMADAGTLSPAMAEMLLNRIAVWPAQLTAYDSGGLEIAKLRRSAEQVLQEDFDIRVFHQRVLEQGSIPLALLRKNIQEWIASQSSLEPAQNQNLKSNTDEFRGFVDGVVEAAMGEHQMVGVSVAVVADGDVRLLKGYGYADRESRTPVDPARHLFRIASVTKTFTFTALMQLVEQGKVDLDADINQYLSDFHLPSNFAAPIRIKDLLSHRAGFEEVTRDFLTVQPERYVPLGTWLPNNIPARVFPPGAVTSYSNYGAALAGYIVEEVSGIPYEDYLQRHIFKPLGMHHSSARQRLPKDNALRMPETLQKLQTSNYSYQAGRLNKADFEILQAPAGSIASTASDMARYMLAHLHEGSWQGGRILSPQTARQMRNRLYPDRPGADFAHGFRSGVINGHQTLEHSGATYTAYASMKMIPTLGIGVFVAVNGADEARANEWVADSILRKLSGPGPGDVALPERSISDEEARQYTGSYLTTRRDYDGIGKLMDLYYGVSEISATPDGLLLRTEGSQAVYYRSISQGLFQSVNDSHLLSFEFDADGRALRYYVNYGHVAHDRMAWRDDPRSFWLALLVASLMATVLLMLTCFGKPVLFPVLTRHWRCSANVLAAALVLLSSIAFMTWFSIYGRLALQIAQWAAMAVGLLLLLDLCDRLRHFRSGFRALKPSLVWVLFVVGAANMLFTFYHWHLLWPWV